MRLRKLFVIGLTLSLLGIGIPAWSETDPRSCNDLMPAGTPSYVVCRWMATPDEAAEIASYWLSNGGQNLQEATPLDPIMLDCGTECPTDGEGDGEVHDVNAPDVDAPDVPGSVDGGTPECQAGEQCYVDGSGLSAAEVQAAESTEGGQAVKTAAADGMRVWLDTELADDWKAGHLAEAAKKVAALAQQQDVVGIRFTTQLGYNSTFTDADEMDRFVAETTAALRKLAPGKKLAAHTVLPVFGCGANEACKTELTKTYPLLDPDRIGAWLSKGLIDQLALDSGHLGHDYAAWKIDATQAQRNQWIEVRARAWDAYAQITAEDAGLAAAGAPKLTADQAAKSITEKIATPIQDDAAETVTLWSRWENEQGQVSRLYGEKWAANTTWDQLKKLGTVRPRLATIYDPTAPEVDAATDLKNLSTVFGQVYLHV
jgi:hypothetical protein